MMIIKRLLRATSSCLLLAAWKSLTNQRYVDGALLSAAFGFSIIGDRMLGYVTDGFLYGVAFFFVAHICYLLFCLHNGRIKKHFLLLFTSVYLIYYFMALKPAINDFSMKIAVLMYLLISCLSLSAACGLKLQKLRKRLFLGGISSLIFSDTLISANIYLHLSDLYFLMFPTYYASQILITLSVIIENTQTEKVADPK